MNIRLLLAGTLSVFSLQSNAQLTAGLVAHWKFNGNVGDSSGSGMHGTPIFMSYGVGKNGNANTAAIFDGTKTYVSVPYQANMNVTNYSICAVVKPMGYYAGDCQTNVILSRGVPNTLPSYGLHYSDHAFDNSCSTADTSKNVFASTAGNTVGAASQWQYTPAIVSNNWYTVIATFRNDTMKVYVNGQLKSRFVKAAGALGTSTEGMFLGATYQGTTGAYPNWLKGYMDDLRLYNRVLTDDEIRYYSYGLYFTPTAPSVLCKNVTYTTPFNTVDNFMPGNSFTLQLSNSSGSFGTPTILNVVTGTQGSNFSYVIPSFVTTGSGYKMRIVASQPFAISDTVNVGIGVASTPPSIYSTVGPTNSIPAGTFTFFTAIGSNGGTAPTFQWKKNGVPIPGADTVTWGATAGVDYAHLDTITITIKSSTYCATPDTATSIPIVMYLTKTGVNQVAEKNISIFPNPSNGSFALQSKWNTNGKVQATVTNAVGQVVYTESLQTKDGQLNSTIKLNEVAAGIYTLRLQSDSEYATVKLTIE